MDYAAVSDSVRAIVSVAGMFCPVASPLQLTTNRRIVALEACSDFPFACGVMTFNLFNVRFYLFQHRCTITNHDQRRRVGLDILRNALDFFSVTACTRSR